MSRRKWEITHEAWAAEHTDVESWLLLRNRSRKPLLSILRNFIAFVDEGGPEKIRGLGPEGLVEFQDKAEGNGEKFLISKALVMFLKSDPRWRSGYRMKVLDTVRSFFKANYAEMPTNENEILALWDEETPPEAREDLTLEALRTIIDKSDFMYQAIFKIMFSTGLGVAEIVHWSNQGVDKAREALQDPTYKPFMRIDLPARKKTGRRPKAQPYNVLLGGDALETFMTYLDKRDRRGEVHIAQHPGRGYPDSIFVSNTHTPLKVNSVQAYWRQRLFRQGITVKSEDGWSGTRYGLSPHQIRDLFRNQAQLAKRRGFDTDIAEFFMGHTSKLDPNKYLDFTKMKPGYMVEQYALLLPYVDIESDLVWGRVDAEIYQTQQTEINQLRVRDREREDQIANLKTMVVKETIPSQAQMIEEGKKHIEILVKNLRGNIVLMKSNIVMAEGRGDAESVAKFKAMYDELRAELARATSRPETSR